MQKTGPGAQRHVHTCCCADSCLFEQPHVLHAETMTANVLCCKPHQSAQAAKSQLVVLHLAQSVCCYCLPSLCPVALAGERLVGSECLVPPEQELRGLKLLQVQLQHLLAGKVRIAPAELRLSSRRWVLKAGKNLLRVSGTAVCAAAGAAVAASLAPRDRAGVWAVRGHLVSDLIFANVLLLMLDGGFALVFGPAGDDQQRRQQQHHSAHFGLAT